MVSCYKPPFVFLTGVEACCLGRAYKSVCVTVTTPGRVSVQDRLSAAQPSRQRFSQEAK